MHCLAVSHYCSSLHCTKDKFTSSKIFLDIVNQEIPICMVNIFVSSMTYTEAQHTHSKLDLIRFRSHYLQTMNSAFHVPDMLALTTEHRGPYFHVTEMLALTSAPHSFSPVHGTYLRASNHYNVLSRSPWNMVMTQILDWCNKSG